jgi:hypothetical protein
VRNFITLQNGLKVINMPDSLNRASCHRLFRCSCVGAFVTVTAMVQLCATSGRSRSNTALRMAYILYCWVAAYPPRGLELQLSTPCNNPSQQVVMGCHAATML